MILGDHADIGQANRSRGVVGSLGMAFNAPIRQERFGIPRPEKVVCIGRNYRAHADEEGAELPTEPLLFAKFSKTLVGPGESTVLPPTSTHVDAEAELVVVIGVPSITCLARRCS
jgi:2-keto-4-pentenoate hydratase/2-oxohepta-3-ene-1,7-dioic acid hydratase in catechol pathway